MQSASIVTVGSEITEGLRLDTNTQEIASGLAAHGMPAAETISVPDDREALSETIRRLCARYETVIVTGGLGPTHDDITREAAATALGLALHTDDRIVRMLQPALARHQDPAARAQVLTQAQVIDGADVLDPDTGTAPGLVVPTSIGRLVLLPGPPKEMRPMLAEVLRRLGGGRASSRELGVAGMTESDVQLTVQRALGGVSGVGFTVLARPGDVRAVLTDAGGGTEAVDRAARAAATALGDSCYAQAGESLAQIVVSAAADRGVTLATAESCTGGLVAAALTDVAGSSAVFRGGVVTYSDASKTALLGVDPGTLAEKGAVSASTVIQMACGVRRALDADIAVSISGIAGPTGGSADKPVGTVWFGVASGAAFRSAGGDDEMDFHFVRTLPGDREGVRDRARAIALDSLRRVVLGLPVG